MAIQQTRKTLQVCESLLAEHRFMETLLLSLESQIKQMAVTTNIKSTDLENIQDLLDTINHELTVHFACEEQALFPAVTPYHPMVLMEVEHEEIVALWDTLLKQFKARQFGEFQDTGKEFVDYLQGHIGREDAGIFPACEQSLSEDEKQQVIIKMDQIREKSKTEIIPAIVRPEKTYKPITMDLTTVSDKPLIIKLLAETPNRQIKHLSIRANESLPSHWSPKELFVFCVSGQAVFTTQPDGHAVDLLPGSGVLLDPQLSHAIQAKTDCHFLMTVG